MSENRRTQNGRGHRRPEAWQRAQSDGSSLAGSRREDCTDRGDRSAEGEGEIVLHGRNPRQPVDTTGGCPPSKDGRGERPARYYRRKTESDRSRGKSARLHDRTSAKMV